MKIRYIVFALFLVACGHENENPANDAELVSLGEKLFFDTDLSNPVGQSCASCHSPATGFSDPGHRAVSPGSNDGMFERRNAPSLTYLKFVPQRYYDEADETYVGGLFLDGRVNSLEEQVIHPFTNPKEMNLEDEQMLVDKIKKAAYFKEYQQVFGDEVATQTVVNNISKAIAAYERSQVFAAFSSKYDLYLRGEAELSAQEKHGLALFTDTAGAMCVNCHVMETDKPLFTDFTYDNIGIPKNKNNPFYALPGEFNPNGKEYIDLGLGEITRDSSNYGQFRVPTLRNVALTAPYFHNGVFDSLEEVVRFYNRRDKESFGSPEVPVNVNHEELGNLGLTEQEEKALVAFLKTLTDGYKAESQQQDSYALKN